MHAGPQTPGSLQHFRRILPVRGGPHDRLRPDLGILAFEDAGTHEHRLGTQRHAQRRVRRRRDAAGGEVRYRQLAVLGDIADEIHGCPKFLGPGRELFPGNHRQRANVAGHLAQVAHCLDDVAAAGLALGPDHRSPFSDAAQGFSQVSRPAHEGRPVVLLVDVVGLVSRGQHFAFVDKIDPQGLENPRFQVMADAHLGHDRN